MGLTNALQNRPVRVLGFITAFHSIVFGLGYLTGVGGFNGALVGIVLYSTIITFGLGSVLSLLGLLLMFAYARQNPKTIRTASSLQAVVWFFIAFLYLLSGAFMLALGVGATWAVLSAYIAYASRNRQNVIAYDRTKKAQQDSLNEDQL